MYNVEFYKGDYLERQRKANDDKCVCYVEITLTAAQALRPIMWW